MPHTAVVVFTGRPLEGAEGILAEQGSRAFRLDRDRTAQQEFLVCTRNRHNTDNFPQTMEPHGAAFLIGRIARVVPSPKDPGRWLIKFNEYIIPPQPIPNIWGRSGHQRYPVRYTTLEDLGIDLSALPPFTPVTEPPQGSGLSEATVPLLTPPRPWAPLQSRPRVDETRDSEARFDAILSQIDRIPDLPVPGIPLDWDEHGLPR